MATTFYPPYSYGGDAVHVYRLTNALARRGHRVTVDTLGESAKLAPDTTYLSGKPGLYASRLKQIFEEPFDVIHFHNPSLLGGPGLLSYGRGVKLFTLNEYWLVCPMH